jgi:hypothetical protein
MIDSGSRTEARYLLAIIIGQGKLGFHFNRPEICLGKSNRSGGSNSDDAL